MPLWDDETANLNNNPHSITPDIKNIPSVGSAHNPLQTWFIVIFISIIIIVLAGAGAVIPVVLTATNPTAEMPIGTILLYGGDISSLIGATYRWLLCDGSEISRTTYRDLFKVIGVKFGAGNGKDTFNLPDFRFRFPLGSNSSNDPLDNGGASSHVLTTAEMPAHTHAVGTLAAAVAGAHNHAITDPGHTHGGSTGSGPGGSGSSNNFGSGTTLAFVPGGTHTHTISSAATSISLAAAPDHTHTLSGSTASQGTNQAFSMMPPYQTIHYIIRA